MATTQKTTPAASAAKKPAAKPRTPVAALEVSAPSTSAVDTIAGDTMLVREIPIALIDAHPRNPRKNLGDLGELAESIRAHGVQQPAKVVPHPDVEGRYLTVMGHRRIAAATMAGRATVPAIVDEGMDEMNQVEVMLVENLQRTDLTISEEGAGYQALLDFGMPQATIVRRTGRAKNTVASRVKIAALPEPVRRYVDQHQLTIDEALAFGEWKDTHPEVWQENLEKLSNPHVMVDVVLGEARRKVSLIEQLAKYTTEWAGRGHKLVVDTETKSWDDPRRISLLGITLDAHAHCPGAELRISTPGWASMASMYGWAICTDAEKYHPDEVAAKNSSDEHDPRSKDHEH